MPREVVTVTGLRDFRNRLRAADRDLVKGLRLAMNEASQLVVDQARPTMPSRTGRMRRSVRVASTQTSSRVRAGGNRAPYYPWVEYGGRTGRNRSVVRQFIKDGRYLYVAYYDLRDSGRFEQVLNDALRAIAQRAGIDFDGR